MIKTIEQARRIQAKRIKARKRGYAPAVARFVKRWMKTSFARLPFIDRID